MVKESQRKSTGRRMLPKERHFKRTAPSSKDQIVSEVLLEILFGLIWLVVSDGFHFLNGLLSWEEPGDDV
jgi:hypothetical protein